MPKNFFRNNTEDERIINKIDRASGECARKKNDSAISPEEYERYETTIFDSLVTEGCLTTSSKKDFSSLINEKALNLQRWRELEEIAMAQGIRFELDGDLFYLNPLSYFLENSEGWETCKQIGRGQEKINKGLRELYISGKNGMQK